MSVLFTVDGRPVSIWIRAVVHPSDVRYLTAEQVACITGWHAAGLHTAALTSAGATKLWPYPEGKVDDALRAIGRELKALKADGAGVMIRSSGPESC
jgi:hypothetical protein